MLNVAIEQIEYAIGTNCVTNQQLEKENPDWRMEEITKKTGVKQRFTVNKDETAADLAVAAAKNILEADKNKNEIDFVILVTSSPDYLLPTTACTIQDRLGLKKNCIAFDINLGCSGFVYGLSIAGSMIESGVAQKGLLLCGDTYSKHIHKHDRVCRPIFSDGAAATLLSKNNEKHLGPFELGTDGSGFNNLIIPGSGTREIQGNAQANQLYMNGSKVFMFTMNTVPPLVRSIVDKAHLQMDDIDLFIFHQASRIVLENIERKLALPPEKVFSNLEMKGNTVSATIPIALKDAETQGRIKRGDTVALIGFGVGLSWGGCIIKW